ncbi:MAG: hypothetical protein A2785_03175 [Candidatus Chisholmbacteria bacterium RIFCSPHIGHO2_01_FULL_49_18]|uniref:Uncharacterized protein n=1 Tax=Candidatus Chisholmbacteria bacterium RIFCSPHIGHO2_01_FULL_49_18 TaxID=1797590 RepID=A0A1G1VMF9_9BACT|nr:MAG: hypothetical protein A2785_03175 [Candidatus Chisholmbacteria bacterium RIFCSPHIGHO2_01_FULL_49_18]
MRSILKFYSASDFIRLFQREIGLSVDDLYVREFRRWLEKRPVSNRRKMLPYDFYIWLLQRAHEYSRLKR